MSRKNWCHCKVYVNKLISWNATSLLRSIFTVEHSRHYLLHSLAIRHKPVLRLYVNHKWNRKSVVSQRQYITFYISWPFFNKKQTKTPRSSPVRARYALSFASSKMEHLLAFVLAVFYEISCCKGPWYNENQSSFAWKWGYCSIKKTNSSAISLGHHYLELLEMVAVIMALMGYFDAINKVIEAMKCDLRHGVESG